MYQKKIILLIYAFDVYSSKYFSEKLSTNDSRCCEQIKTKRSMFVQRDLKHLNGSIKHNRLDIDLKMFKRISWYTYIANLWNATSCYKSVIIFNSISHLSYVFLTTNCVHRFYLSTCSALELLHANYCEGC